MGNRRQRRNSRSYSTKNVSKVSCEICSEVPHKMFKNPNKCAHPYCLDCMIKHIGAKVDQGMSRIICPDLNCRHHLDPLFVKLFIPSLVFNNWCNLLCESSVRGIDKCYCPNKECSVLILNECGGSVSRSECPKCKKLFCFKCQVAWYSGLRCEEVRDANDVAFGVLAQKNQWQRCPSCHHFIERISGCNSIHCRCGAYFCDDCLINNNVNVCRCSW